MEHPSVLTSIHRHLGSRPRLHSWTWPSPTLKRARTGLPPSYHLLLKLKGLDTPLHCRRVGTAARKTKGRSNKSTIRQKSRISALWFVPLLLCCLQRSFWISTDVLQDFVALREDEECSDSEDDDGDNYQWESRYQQMVSLRYLFPYKRESRKLMKISVSETR